MGSASKSAVAVTDMTGPHERREVFERFVAEHGDRLLRAAYAMCGDWQDAQDLVQLVLCKLADHWDDVVTNRLGYAFRCLTRAHIDRWRILRRRPEMLVEPAALNDWESPARPDAVDDHLALLSALRALPRRQRAIIVLRYLEDLSEQETAALLGISAGAVKSGASRGLARLRSAWRASSEESE